MPICFTFSLGISLWTKPQILQVISLIISWVFNITSPVCKVGMPWSLMAFLSILDYIYFKYLKQLGIKFNISYYFKANSQNCSSSEINTILSRMSFFGTFKIYGSPYKKLVQYFCNKPEGYLYQFNLPPTVFTKKMFQENNV